MKKIVQRLLTFTIGIPLCFIFTWFCPFANHVVMNLFISIAALIGANEVRNMLSQNLAVQPRALVLSLSAIISITAVVCAAFSLPMEYISYSFILSLLLLLFFEIFNKKSVKDSFAFSVESIVTSLFTILYTAYLLSFIQRMGVWEFSKENIVVFLLMVFICDSLAWLLGVTLGASNRGFVKVSPNKSLVGFAGGFLGSIAVGVLAKFLMPHVFEGSFAKIIILGFLTALASILGDLSESVIKRSTHMKDSGCIIPGRGGIMDSIDSIIFAAPVYYIAAGLLYHFK